MSCMVLNNNGATSEIGADLRFLLFLKISNDSEISMPLQKMEHFDSSFVFCPKFVLFIIIV